jgi:cytochrome b subunit of formate dehydrogenase
MKQHFMSRTRVLFVVAVLAAVAFLVEIVSGFVLWLVLPSGSGVGHAGPRQTWLDIHDWAGVVFIVIIAVHIYMHRKWLNHQLKLLFKSR